MKATERDLALKWQMIGQLGTGVMLGALAWFIMASADKKDGVLHDDGTAARPAKIDAARSADVDALSPDVVNSYKKAAFDTLQKSQGR